MTVQQCTTGEAPHMVSGTGRTGISAGQLAMPDLFGVKLLMFLLLCSLMPITRVLTVVFLQIIVLTVYLINEDHEQHAANRIS